MAGVSVGSILTGLANGLSAVPQQLNDLAFQQQSRQQQLQAGALANQAQGLQNQQYMQQLQNAQLTQQFAVQGLQDASNPQGTGSQSAQPAQVLASTAAPQSAAQVTYGNFKPQGPLSVQQLAGLDEKYGLPPGTAYGLMAAESNGNPNAVSPKGAVGLFQVEPSTAQQPGYGLKPFDPKDPDGALSYFAKMYQKAGGDMNKALAYWNAGPGGNPNNPETQGFIPRVQKNAQLFAQAQQLDTAKQQPTPADQITARTDAGAPTPITAYQQATQAQGQQIQAALASAKRAEQAGYPQLAQQFYTRAQTLQDQQIELQTKSLAVQKAANTDVAQLATGVKDQSSYNNLRAQIQQNPAMQAAVAGLNLTGDYNQDRNKLQTLADRTVTLKDQQELQIKQGELALKQQAAQREQQKLDQPKIAQQQAITADQTRKQAIAAKGIPFAPSIAATAPIGTTSTQVQQAQKQVATQNAAYDKANAPAVQGAKNVRDQAAQAYVMLDKGGLSTGGVVNTVSDAVAPWSLNPQQQEFNKLTNGLVQSMQLLAGANGGARSASTAAMYKNFAMAKPNIRLSATANKEIAHGLYVGAAAQTQMNNFLDEYRQANPDASVQSGVLAWRGYEQALGPTMIYDTSQKAMVPNMAGIPNLEDGTPNPDYKDYHVYFANGGHW